MGGGKTREEIAADRKLQLALTRLIEVVGEAAARTSQESASVIPRFPGPR